MPPWPCAGQTALRSSRAPTRSRSGSRKLRGISGRADFRGFSDADALLAAGKLADVMIVATQDNDHYRHCTGALRLGYNVLLEKPISTRVGQVLEIERLARQMDRRVMVCFVLRFAAFYRKVKEIIDSGALGELVSIQASEGVMPWHQAHSFVRGHWSVVKKSSPMILSKCCHDTDIAPLAGGAALPASRELRLAGILPPRARARRSAGPLHGRLPGRRHLSLQCAALHQRHARAVAGDGL